MTTQPKAEILAEYKVADDDGYFLVRPSDVPGLTDVFYVDRTETIQEGMRKGCGRDAEGMRRGVLTMNPDSLKCLIRALERRLPEAIAEDEGETT